MRRRVFAFGVAAAAVYLVAAAVTFEAGLLPSRPLYDGTAPPEPYRFIDPPPDLAATNKPPIGAEDTVPLGEDEFLGATVLTDDNQAFVIFDPGGVAQPPGAENVKITIEPLDPATIGDPPDGLAYDGNAYRITGIYQPSGETIEMTAVAKVLLRYPFAATTILRRDGDVWTELEVKTGGGFDLFADTDRLGVFVPAGLPFHRGGDSKVGDIVYAVAGLAVVVVGVLLGRRRASVKKQVATQRALGKKAKRPNPK